MNVYADSTREAIRSGEIMCACKKRHIAMGNMLTTQIDYHFADCRWRAAVDAIYRRERAEEAARL